MANKGLTADQSAGAKNRIRMKYPATWWGAPWRDAIPAGNGKMGIAVYGGIARERVLLTHGNLWWKGCNDPLPDVRECLPVVREALLSGRPTDAEFVYTDALREAGYTGRVACPLPLGDLLIEMPLRTAFKHYRRELDMETGEIVVSWQDGADAYTRSTFVSRTDDMVVYEICANNPGRIYADVSLDLHDRRDTHMPYSLPDTALPQRLETLTEDGWIYYAAEKEPGTDFGAVARVTADGGSLSCCNGKVSVAGADRVQILIRFFVDGERRIQWEALRSSLEPMTDQYDQYRERHAKLHRALFCACEINLFAQGREMPNEELLLEAYDNEAPLALVEKLWAYGRYLLLSATCEDGQPCPLMGLWCGEYEGFWAFNMANENLQMIYWQALAGNMPSLMLSVFRYYESKLEDFRENAAKLFGCRGIFIPAPTSPQSGILQDIQPHIVCWTGAAGWIAQMYYDYYRHTGDRKFLKTRAIPFMTEAAQFYSDFFIIGTDGYLISCPSESPENTPSNLLHARNSWSGHHEQSLTINATMDFAIARELFSNLLEACTLVGVHQEKMGEWQDLLKRIPPYALNADGSVKEWIFDGYEDNDYHRHQSHIYPLFPGCEVSREKAPELYEAFIRALNKRLVIGLCEQTGWSLAHMANTYARIGEGDRSLECLDAITRSCLTHNLYTLHNDFREMGIGTRMDWAPFQMDANSGYTAAVQRMLLDSVGDTVYILPALPGRFVAGRATGMLAAGNVLVDIEWDQRAEHAQVWLHAQIPLTSISLVFPGPINTGDYVACRQLSGLALKKGETRSFTFALN